MQRRLLGLEKRIIICQSRSLLYICPHFTSPLSPLRRALHCCRPCRALDAPYVPPPRACSSQLLHIVVPSRAAPLSSFIFLCTSISISREGEERKERREPK